MIADRWVMTAAHVLTSDGNTASKETVRVRDYYCIGVMCMHVASIFLK